MVHVTFVKKILASGELCNKCRDVWERLCKDGLIDKIDHIAIADETNADSEGIRLARQHKVKRAPFFLVSDEADNTEAFDVYFKFKKFMADQ